MANSDDERWSTGADLMPNRYIPNEVELDSERLQLITRREEVLGASYRLLYKNPVHFVRGDGMYLYGTDGSAFLDFYNNVTSLGHAEETVIAAITAEMRRGVFHPRYLDERIVDYSERLVTLFPKSLDRVIYTCTGSESNDLALRIARHATGGSGLIVTEHAYHGTSQSASEISPNLGREVKLSPYVRTVRLPGAYGIGDDEAEAFFTRELRGAIEDLDRRGIRLAAFVLDSIFSSDGVHIEPSGFVRGAIDAVRAAGGLVISDEVQPGLGRLGGSMWGFTRQDFTPDLVTLGKPMGNGYPVGAVVGRAEVINAFGQTARYTNTFAGTNIAMAAAGAVLDVIEEKGLLPQVTRVGAELKSGLEALMAQGLPIRAVRGEGLYYGVDVGDAHSSASERWRFARNLVNFLRESHVLIGLCGKYEDTLKIRPPLITQSQDVRQFLAALEEALVCSGAE